MLLCRELERDDIRHNFPACAVQATLCNLQRNPEDTPRAWSPWDFMPGFRLKEEAPKRVSSAEELSAFFGAVKNG